jgi:hypothetical protein
MPDELPEFEGQVSARSSDAKYANYFEIGHNAFEFLLDFGQLFSGDQAGRIHTRIITSPYEAKQLLKLLEASVRQYEDSFGSIPDESPE